MTETTALSSGGSGVAGSGGGDARPAGGGEVRGTGHTDVLGAANSDILGAGSRVSREELVLGGPRRSRLRGFTDPASPLPTYAGVVIALVGFALIAVAWGKVAGLVDVWRQMPYLLSAGLPGLGLVMTGLLVVNISARRQDAAERARQMATLTEALRELRQSLDTQ